MDILEILNASHKKCIARYILEALPEWFGLPDSRKEYIQDSADNRFFCAYIGEQPVGFLCLKQTGKDTVELAVMGGTERVSSSGNRKITL